MRGETAAARGAAPGESSRASGGGSGQIAGEGAGGLQDAGSGGGAEDERAVGGKGTGVVQGEHTFGNGGDAGVGIVRIPEVPLAGGGLGQAGDVGPRAAVGELGGEGVVAGGGAGEGESLRTGNAMDDGPRVAPHDGIVVAGSAGKGGPGAGQGEEAVRGGGAGAEREGTINDAAAIDEASGGAAEHQVGRRIAGGPNAAILPAICQEIHRHRTCRSTDGCDPCVGVETAPGRGTGGAALGDVKPGSRVHTIPRAAAILPERLAGLPGDRARTIHGINHGVGVRDTCEEFKGRALADGQGGTRRGQTGCGSVEADLTFIDRRRSRLGVGAEDDQRTRPILGQATRLGRTNVHRVASGTDVQHIRAAVNTNGDVRGSRSTE